VILGDGQGLALAKDARGGGGTVDVLHACSFEDVERADDVDGRVGLRVGDGAGVADASSEMQDHSAAVDRGADRLAAAHVTFEEGHAQHEVSLYPLEMLSSTTGLWPSPSKRSTIFEPMKPAPPVTSAFIDPLSCPSAQPRPFRLANASQRGTHAPYEGCGCRAEPAV